MSEAECEKQDLKHPDCEKCIGHLLLAGNKDAWQVYQAVQGQVILSSMDRVVVINQLAIWEYIDHYKITNPVKVFEQVRQVSQTIINNQNVEQKG